MACVPFEPLSAARPKSLREKFSFLPHHTTPMILEHFRALTTEERHRTTRLVPGRAPAPRLSQRLAGLVLIGLAGCHASEAIPREVSLLDARPATEHSGPEAPNEPRVVSSAARPSSPLPVHVATGASVSRVSPVAAACRGSALELPPDLDPCACDKVQTFVSPSGSTSIRAGDWCGPPLDEEKGPPETVARLEKVVLAPGEAARVRIVLRNPEAETRVYRARSRYLWARFVKPSGQLLSTVGLGFSHYSDEAMIELPPGGRANVVLELPGMVARWRGKEVVTAPLGPGAYAVEVDLGSLGGKRLLPVEVK